ncbi:Major facilitator superfamily domain, general substrate transporter [Metarhizium brunneum]
MSSTSEDLKGTTSPWKRLFRARASDSSKHEKQVSGHSKWSFGVLNDKQTVEVPGSVLLLAANRNEPLGLRDVHARTSHSSIPTGFFVDMPLTPGGSRPVIQTPAATEHVDPHEGKKKTQDGAIILDPQPEDSVNDPLNWPSWRRDTALLSLGFYCMIGGGITSIMAAGFTNIAHDMDVEVETVSLTVGLYMMGLGVGSVFASPTAILFGKRPVYLASVILFIATCVWGGYSPTFPSLLAARVFQGIAISPVECLPSATIAEIYFLHERAYRIGIYTLLLLGGKNLIPLVSAAIIGRYGWRWVFFIVAMVAGLGFVLLFLFVPETFWDRTPTRKPSKRPSFLRRLSSRRNVHNPHQSTQSARDSKTLERPHSPGAETRQRGLHVGFTSEPPTAGESQHHGEDNTDHMHPGSADHHATITTSRETEKEHVTYRPDLPGNVQGQMPSITVSASGEKSEEIEAEPNQVDTNVPLVHVSDEHHVMDGASSVHSPIRSPRSILRQSHNGSGGHSPYLQSANGSGANIDYFSQGPNLDNERIPASALRAPPRIKAYTHNLRQQPAQTFTQQLKPYHGRLNNDRWLKVMIRPFILFSYPAVLWSSAVYACSIGWLIVISETMAVIYRDPASYNFGALQTGLVYVSPFVGGVLGTGVAGKISDLIVRAMSRRNGGMYEPEFRLVMAIPIMLTTCIGLMGFGWSAQEKDHWMIPTAFFGILSFGCSLGSTTAITFCVDSYRQYAGEALVTLNFSKNVLHGLVFSLFVSHWMAKDGPKQVYMWLGIIQLLVQLTTIPLFIFGKRARMWTVRMNLMEKF